MFKYFITLACYEGPSERRDFGFVRFFPQGWNSVLVPGKSRPDPAAHSYRSGSEKQEKTVDCEAGVLASDPSLAPGKWHLRTSISTSLGTSLIFFFFSLI